MPEKECLKSENCVYFYLTTAVWALIIAYKPEINGQAREKGYNNPVSG